MHGARVCREGACRQKVNENLRVDSVLHIIKVKESGNCTWDCNSGVHGVL